MKCLDLEHGAIVLCETIDTTPLTAAKVCPYVGKTENEQPEYEMFVDMGFLCTEATTLDFDRLDEFTTLEEFQGFFNSFCRNDLRAVKYCVGELSSNSVVCQNQTSHQMLSIFTDFLETTLETGCQQDGGTLATILHGSMSHAKSDVESGQMEVCLDTAGSQLNNTSLASDALSAKSVIVYRAFESLKECIINGNYEAGLKNIFGTFVNEILRSFKCVHPNDGTTVLCETIVNNLA